MSVSESIGGNAYFSEPYVVYRNVAITLASRKIVLTKIADLAGRSVAAYQNARLLLGDEFKAVKASHVRYVEHADQAIQNRLLFSGQVDVVISDRFIFDHFTTALTPQFDPGQPVVYHPIFPATPRRAAFRNPAVRERFNVALKGMQQDGSQAAIYRKYNVVVDIHLSWNFIHLSWNS